MNYSVVQCVNNLDLGGLERVVVILARQLRARGISCDIVCVEDRGALADEAEREGIRVTALHAEKAGKRAALRQLIAALQSRPRVVLHSHNFKPFWYAARARFHGAADGHVHTRHGAFIRRHRFVWRYRLMRRWTDAIVTVSRDGREELGRLSGLPVEQIGVVPNGIDTDTHRPAADKKAVRQQLGWNVDGPVIITVSRLAPEKDLGTLLRAMQCLPQANLWLVGYGPEETALRELAKELAVADRVTFWGRRDDVPALLSAADVFALSSLSEGLSMALIEAAACGLPMVATQVGGNHEIVDPPHGGLLVPVGQPLALAAAIDGILRSPERRLAMGNHARRHAEMHFSVRTMVDRYVTFYEQAVRKFAGG